MRYYIKTERMYNLFKFRYREMRQSINEGEEFNNICMQCEQSVTVKTVNRSRDTRHE